MSYQGCILLTWFITVDGDLASLTEAVFDWVISCKDTFSPISILSSLEEVIMRGLHSGVRSYAPQ